MYQAEERIEFTPAMKDEYTILMPNMLPIHFELIANVMRQHGYRVELLNNNGRAIVDEGLKYVHNDTCYPALMVIGQMISAIKSGDYDTNKLALMMTQTGGGCRASNYIHLLRKALKKAGYGHIPVISLNFSGLEKNSGFKITLSMAVKAAVALLYGDLLMTLRNQVVPYEVHTGSADALTKHWTEALSTSIAKGRVGSVLGVRKTMNKIVRAYADIPTTGQKKIKVGIVGEIYVKYADFANNHVADFLLKQDCEVIIPGLLAFMSFMADVRAEDIRLYGGSRMKLLIFEIVLAFLNRVDRMLIRAIRKHPKFAAPTTFKEMKPMVSNVVGYGCKMGEGWLLTAEILELIESGCENIVCAQPFGCLPNHISGKGMIRKVRALHPNANIVAVDYDPGATKVNQENRIKLMLSLANEQFEEMEGMETENREVCELIT